MHMFDMFLLILCYFEFLTLWFLSGSSLMVERGLERKITEMREIFSIYCGKLSECF